MKGGSRAAGEFITETEEQVKERGGEKEILPSFISQPTDVLPSKRQQAGGKATQPQLYTANMTPTHTHTCARTCKQQSRAWRRPKAIMVATCYTF